VWNTGTYTNKKTSRSSTGKVVERRSHDKQEAGLGLNYFNSRVEGSKQREKKERNEKELEHRKPKKKLEKKRSPCGRPCNGAQKYKAGVTKQANLKNSKSISQHTGNGGKKGH